MVLHDKEVSIWEDNQTKILPVYPWRHAEMRGELMGDLLPSGKLDVFQSHSYSGYSQRAPHQVSIFFSGLNPG